jgi:regulator of replication initiation timing
MTDTAVISALKDKVSGIVSITARQIQAELDTTSSFDYIGMAQDIVKKVEQLGDTCGNESLGAQLLEVADKLARFTLENESLTLENESLRAQQLEITEELEQQKTQTTHFHEQVLEQKLELSSITREAEFQEKGHSRQKVRNGSLRGQVSALSEQLSNATAEAEWQKTEKVRIHRMLLDLQYSQRSDEPLFDP